MKYLSNAIWKIKCFVTLQVSVLVSLKYQYISAI